ncbi:hypothetical protein JCM10207_001053 [Rhodosporidiobolus poonsookiae]
MIGAERSTDPPPWSLWLEGYYRMHHPDTWVLLDADHAADRAYFVEVSGRYSEGTVAGAAQGEMVELRDAVDEIVARMVWRFRKVYALNAVRQEYIEHHRQGMAPPFDPADWDNKITKETLEMEDYPPCPVAEYSGTTRSVLRPRHRFAFRAQLFTAS